MSSSYAGMINVHCHLSQRCTGAVLILWMYTISKHVPSSPWVDSDNLGPGFLNIPGWVDSSPVIWVMCLLSHLLVRSTWEGHEGVVDSFLFVGRVGSCLLNKDWLLNGIQWGIRHRIFFSSHALHWRIRNGCDGDHEVWNFRSGRLDGVTMTNLVSTSCFRQDKYSYLRYK